LISEEHQTNRDWASNLRAIDFALVAASLATATHAFPKITRVAAAVSAAEGERFPQQTRG